MPTLVYGKCSRAKNNAAHNVLFYQPDRKHYYHAMRLVDAIMANNRMKNGRTEYNARSGKYRVTIKGACSPVVFRVRKMA